MDLNHILPELKTAVRMSNETEAMFAERQKFGYEPPITSFSGYYSFLSNFSPVWVDLGGQRYRTIEHAYQAAKTEDPKERQMVRDATTPRSAKRIGQRVTKRKDWDQPQVKDEIMLNLLRQKFFSSILGLDLIDTGMRMLVEGNTWNDTYWGVCNHKGENRFGHLLMQVRAELVLCRFLWFAGE